MTKTNEHIVEVLCAMWFEPTLNDWDSTYFGKYYSRITELGYTEKQEQKKVEVQLEINANKPNPTVKEEGIRFIFRNPSEKTAIILSDHFISFHKMAPYNDWNSLMGKIVDPGLKIYKEIGLGKGLKEVQCLYLNSYKIRNDQMISDKFKFLPQIDDSKESSLLFQAKYDMPENLSVQIKLNWNALAPKKEVFFECSTFAKASEGVDYKTVAAKAHDQANAFYNKIYSDADSH